MKTHSSKGTTVLVLLAFLSVAIPLSSGQSLTAGWEDKLSKNVYWRCRTV